MSTALFTDYMETAIGQLKRATEQEQEGNRQNAKCIEEEWKGVSAMNLLTINVDTFVKQC